MQKIDVLSHSSLSSSGKIPALGKRDIVQLDFTNGRNYSGKLAERIPLAEKNEHTTSISEKQKRAAIDHCPKLHQGGTTVPTYRHDRNLKWEETGMRITRAVKLKSTPVSHGRKKKTAFKVQLPKPVMFSEELMDVDTSDLTICNLLNRVPEDVNNIDNHNDYFLSPEYAQDIVNYMQAREDYFSLSKDFLNQNPEVTSQMRAILMDWLIQVQTHQQLENETLQLSVRIVDQYLARSVVPLQQLQLLGITCLFIAAKFIERFPPLITSLCALTADTYIVEEVIMMERSVLCELKFDVSLPVPQFFLDRYIRVHPHDSKVKHLSMYLIDLSLPSVHFVTVPASLLAASALYLSRKLFLPDKTDTWTLDLAFYSKYSDADLKASVRLLAKILMRASSSKYQGARTKHGDKATSSGISKDLEFDNHPTLLGLIVDG